MSKEKIIYHGSHKIIEHPTYGVGSPNNDYGLGFYCTEYVDLAKEWACDQLSGGYANKYSIDMSGLKILNLNSKEYNIIHWVSVLLKNRKVTLTSDIEQEGMYYILDNFPVDTESYDVIIGYRADDSYFSYARDFLSNTITVKRLTQVMRLGNLGNQIVINSHFRACNFWVMKSHRRKYTTLCARNATNLQGVHIFQTVKALHFRLKVCCLSTLSEEE